MNAAEAVNLNIQYKWDTFVFILMDDKGTHFCQDFMDFVDVMDVAIFFGFKRRKNYIGVEVARSDCADGEKSTVATPGGFRPVDIEEGADPNGKVLKKDKSV
ncbi:unnamed protein product [Lepeophtheirus salmonis]|uniref:(salmon louse) hypothetical protein n=1 Tax=Lepeophtheirus salmonis TaxID=72036 RepID=A0A7R8D046_LEPSM|nr:unnamed protein product [Lepeophtheirus salmonis]CAF2980838.1 unnamed protein product [Lepeophtheirus salmonis]